MREVRETKMSPAKALSMARKDRVLRYDRYLGPEFVPKAMESFQLKDGRYVYKANDEETGNECYKVLEGVPEAMVNELDELDHQWLLNERYKLEHEDYASVKGDMYETDVESDAVSPFDQKSYNDWFAKEMADDIAEEVPINPAYEIIRMCIASLSPEERRLFDLCFDSSMTTAEIREEMDISTKQALSNRKARLLEKFRKVFRAAGYEVPSAKELRAEKKAAKE